MVLKSWKPNQYKHLSWCQNKSSRCVRIMIRAHAGSPIQRLDAGFYFANWLASTFDFEIKFLFLLHFVGFGTINKNGTKISLNISLKDSLRCPAAIEWQKPILLVSFSISIRIGFWWFLYHFEARSNRFQMIQKSWNSDTNWCWKRYQKYWYLIRWHRHSMAAGHLEF